MQFWKTCGIAGPMRRKCQQCALLLVMPLLVHGLSLPFRPPSTSRGSEGIGSRSHPSSRLPAERRGFSTPLLVTGNAGAKHTEPTSWNREMQQECLSRGKFLGIEVGAVTAALAAGTLAPRIVAAASEASSSNPVVTSTCLIEVRIMEPLNESNNFSSVNAYRGKMLFGLYGKAAPKAVENFLKYALVDAQSERPSYASSQMMRMVPGVILEGGKIKGLNTILIGGQEELEYGGEILASPLLLESSGLPHNRRGLLTRPSLARGPEFGITLGAAPGLERDHSVFGVLLEGDDVLRRLEEVPIITGTSTQEEGSIADNIFRAQKVCFFLFCLSSLALDVMHDVRDNTSFLLSLPLVPALPAKASK
ncbi:unnamed protein product [Discosporangium mesarthrocarpum]